MLSLLKSILSYHLFAKAHHEGNEANKKTEEGMADPYLPMGLEILSALVNFGSHGIKV